MSIGNGKRPINMTIIFLISCFSIGSQKKTLFHIKRLFFCHIIGQSENLCVIIARAYKHPMSCLAFLAPDCKEDVMIGLSAFSLSSSSGCRRRFSSSASPNTSSLRFRGDLRALLAGWRLLGVVDDVLVNQLLVTLTSCTWNKDVYQRVDRGLNIEQYISPPSAISFLPL
jgi:hypothetical protein